LYATTHFTRRKCCCRAAHPRFLPFKRRLGPPPFGCAAMSARGARHGRLMPPRRSNTPRPFHSQRMRLRTSASAFSARETAIGARMRGHRDTGGTGTPGGTGRERHRTPGGSECVAPDGAAPDAGVSAWRWHRAAGIAPAAPPVQPVTPGAVEYRRCEPDVIRFASSASDRPTRMTAATTDSTRARSPPGSASRPHMH
jgi:hypothetical protein